MLDKMTNRLDFLGNALILRAERQRVIASNIANADTPGFVARDFKFSEALSEATSSTSAPGVTKLATAGSASTQSATDPRHMPVSTAGDARARLAYAVQSQPALDNNTVDLDRERANFVDNSVRYEAALRFINGNAKTMLSAIQGQ